MIKENRLVIYKDKSGETQLEVKLKKETLWLSLNQIAKLFRRDKSVISRHLKNIFNEHELEKDAVVAKYATTATDGKVYQVDYYSLDAIISLGYRVNSTQGTQFRIWANNVLKQYLLEGYAINQKLLAESQNRLKELQETIRFLTKKSRNPELEGQEKGLFTVLDYYSDSISVLGKYDSGKIRKPKGKIPSFRLSYIDASKVVSNLKKQLLSKKEASALFGLEIDNRFKAVIGSLYQTFNGTDLYRSIEEKAANLLYLLIKDHPFSDGNKRIASILFVYFLEKNNYLFRENGERKINDSALVAIAILTATSDPKEKETIIKLIMSLIKD